MKKYDIAFDLDGTLIDISKRDYYVYYDILNDNMYKPLEFGTYWKLRRNKTNIFEILSLSTDNNEFHDFFLKKRSTLIECADYLKMDTVFEPVYDVLEKLNQTYNLSLITLRNNIEGTKTQLNNLNLTSCFDSISIVQGVKYDTYSKIPNLKFIIGDTENDVLAGLKLNIQTIGVTTGIRNKNQLNKLHPQYIIEDIIEVLNIIL